MIRYLFFLPLIMLLPGSCASGGYEKAEDAQDAGRMFIRASLDGDYARARFYLLKDTTNLLLIEQQQRNYLQLHIDEKKQHKESTIRPVSIVDVNDSVTTYKYFNTYNIKDTTTITIVRLNGEWVVDLKSILKM